MSEPDRTPADRLIELRVERISHLFDALDPFPIPSRDLAKHAEEFIVGWARELRGEAEINILVHVPVDEANAVSLSLLRDAFSRHFSARVDAVSGDLHELFRVGRLSLAIGLGVLAVCIVAGRLAGGFFGDTYLGRFFGEGLIIVGWVANWRPIEIFLYDWWPILRLRRLYRRLARAGVEVRAN